MLLRPHHPADRGACLAAFDSNVPAFFAESERAGFVEYLDALLPRGEIRPLVVEAGGVVVATGGVGLRAGEARMCWGIVHAAHHGRGLGECFLLARLLLGAAAGADRAGLDTIPKTTTFFARHGFSVVRAIDDGYGPGLHRRDMALTFEPERLAALRASFTAAAARVGLEVEPALAAELTPTR